MAGGPATLDGIEGTGLVRVTQRGTMPVVSGTFRPALDADGGDVFALVGQAVEYVGPVEQGEGIRRMKVQVTVADPENAMAATAPLRLHGAGSIEPLD